MKNILNQIQSTLSQKSSEQKKDENKTSSIKWFSTKIQKIKNETKGKINPESNSTKKTILNESKSSKTFRFKKPGYMYFFQYVPPNAKQLPFYDEFPIILSLGFTANYAIGINLHYLPPRIRLLFALQITKSMVDAKNDISKVRIGSLLANKTIRKYIYALSEQYYYAGIRSKIKLIGPKEFMIMSFLPMQKFKKKQSPQIYKFINQAIKNIR